MTDDLEGIAKFSDRYDPKTHKLQNSYKVGDKEFKNTDFCSAVAFPGSVIRWLRLNIGKKFVEIGKDAKGHSVCGYIQDPFRHHLINLVLQLVNLVLGYTALHSLFGQEIAFIAIMLYSVHPVGNQTVAWCSGIGYLICLFGALATLNVALYIPNPYIYIPLATLFSFISSFGLFAGTLNFIILVMIGAWIPAVIAFSTLFLAGLSQAKQILGIRKGEFKKQNMGRSTYLNWRKPIVMIKTLWYYYKLILFPKSLGLFHKWGYHYEDRIERTDGSFWKGLLATAGIGVLFFFSPFVVKFGIVWFFVYISIFSNFITAMQFVADRYLFIPCLGFCIVAAYFLSFFLPLFYVILGIYIMRVWVHLPTYQNEVTFYESNVFNFPTSEVAKGNLGVAYMHSGRQGKAVDTWTEATQDNDFYDVPHYNLYAVLKNAGRLQEAKVHLEKCLNSRIVHFNDVWQKEYEQLKIQIGLSRPTDSLTQEMNRRLL